MSQSKELIETTVRESMAEVAQAVDAQLADDFGPTTPLLESGLDSLGFAMLVATLEEKLGYDPFVTSETATYPTTLEEFINFYFENQS